MANFDKSGMTQQGINLMGKAIGGATIQFTKLVLGDGEMKGEIVDLQGVVSAKQNVDVTRIERKDNQCTVGGELLTSSVKQGFFWRECGLYAMDPDAGEILYNYAYSTKPDYIAASDSGMMEEILVSMVATVGSNTNVNVTIDDSMVFATKKELQDVDKEISFLITQKRDKNEKITRHDLDITKEDSKIRMVNLSDEVRGAIAGTSPILPSIGNGDVTMEKIANRSVTKMKLSEDVFLDGYYTSLKSLGYQRSVGVSFVYDARGIELNQKKIQYSYALHPYENITHMNTKILVSSSPTSYGNPLETYDGIAKEVVNGIENIFSGEYTFKNSITNGFIHLVAWITQADIAKFSMSELSFMHFNIDGVEHELPLAYIDYSNSATDDSCYDKIESFAKAIEVKKNTKDISEIKETTHNNSNSITNIISEINADTYFDCICGSETQHESSVGLAVDMPVSAIGSYLDKQINFSYTLYSDDENVVGYKAKILFVNDNGVIVDSYNGGNYSDYSTGCIIDFLGSYLSSIQGATKIRFLAWIKVANPSVDARIRLNGVSISTGETIIKPNDLYVYEKTDSSSVHITYKGGVVYTETFNNTIERIDRAIKSPLNGKVWNAIGDSFTEVNSHTLKNYHKVISEKTGCTVNNYGVSGSGYGIGTNSPILDRINDFDINADIVTVFASTNDWDIGTRPLGNIQDTTRETVCGSINLTLEALIRKYQSKTLAVITSTPRYDSYGSFSTNTKNGYTLKQLNNAIVAICENLSIPCLNLYDKSGMYPHVGINNKDRTVWFTDGLHPNTKGHELIASKVLNFFNSLGL